MTESDTVTVKMFSLEGWENQFPGSDPVWGRCRFVFGPKVQDYDWLVVYEDLVGPETLPCPPGQTLLVTTEPSSIKTYGRAFLDQFGVVLTSQELWALQHPQVVRSQPGLKWFYGWPLNHREAHRRTYDEIAAGPPVEKSKVISTLCSEKKQNHTLHRARHRFTHQLKAALPELDLFGWGNKELVDKADGIDPYRYHLAIENHRAPHHWTEKLADAFLGLSLPFYAGCPNVFDYFPEESLIQLDLDDVGGAIQTIKKAIADNEYAKRLPAIREARRRVLTQYNFFAVVSALIEAHHPAPSPEPVGQMVYPRRMARRQSLRHAAQYAWENLLLKSRGRWIRWSASRQRTK